MVGLRVAEGFLGRERATEPASQEGLRCSSRTEHLGQHPKHDEPRAAALRGGGLGAGGVGTSSRASRAPRVVARGGTCLRGLHLPRACCFRKGGTEACCRWIYRG